MGWGTEKFMEYENTGDNEYNFFCQKRGFTVSHMVGLLAELPCGICITEMEEPYTVLFANHAFCTMFYGQKELEEIPGGCNLMMIFGEEHFPDFSRELLRLLTHAAEEPLSIEEAVHIKDGEEKHISFSFRKPRDGQDFLLFSLYDCTKWKQTETELGILEKEQQILTQQTGSIIVKYDVKAKTLIQSKEAAEMFGLPLICPDVPYSVCDRLVAQESRQVYIRFYESMMDGKPYGSSFVQMRNVTGHYAWYAFKYTLTYDAQGQPFRAIISYEDVTDQQEKELAYKRWQNYFATQKADCISHYEYDLTMDAFESLVGELPEGLPQEELKSFTSVTQYICGHWIFEEDRTKYLDFFSRNKLLVKYYMGEKELALEHRRIRSDKTVFWTLAVLQMVADPYTNHIKASILIKDINEEKESMMELRQLSSTDPLTGLYNRAFIEKKTDELFRVSAPTDSHMILMIDLDNFKQLNDTLGHQFGDKVLCDVADVLRREIRRDDLCARLGGDEFIVLLKNTGLDVNLSNRLQRLCSSLFRTYEKGIQTSASIGLAIYPRDGKTFHKLYAKADAALYQAKRNGRNQFVFFEN